MAVWDDPVLVVAMVEGPDLFALTPEQQASLGPTESFNGDYRTSQAGIGYLILLGTVPPNFGFVALGGTVWYPHLGWFTPLDGYGYLLPRYALEFRHSTYWAVPPVSFTGGIIHLPVGVTGQITVIRA